MYKTDILIIGAGPAGIYTAFQAGILGMRSCVIDTLDRPGGQCTFLYPDKPIYDIPAYPEIKAQLLIDKLLQQASRFAPKYLLNQTAIRLKRDKDQFEVITSKGIKIYSKVIIIAAGAGSFTYNKPPIKELEQFEGSSVFYYVVNRNNFYGKKIVIAGGGDTAIDWAINLSSVAKVYLVHRRDKFRASPSSVEKMRKMAKEGLIELIVNYQLTALRGKDQQLEEVIISNYNGEIKTIKANILLSCFGLIQKLGSILEFGLNIKNHHIEVSYPYCETNIAGIYAVGDIAYYKGKLKLILTSFAESAFALHHAYNRVFEGKALHFEYSTTKKVFKEK